MKSDTTKCTPLQILTLYYGADVLCPDGIFRKIDSEIIQSAENGQQFLVKCRTLSSMTEEEKTLAVNPLIHALNSIDRKKQTEQAAELIYYLLKKGFDLFGLIESGLALQSPQTTLPK